MAKTLMSWSLVWVTGVALWATKTQVLGVPQPPQLDPNEWWGPSEMQGRTNTSIREFRVCFGDKMVEDLRNRLRNHRELIPPLEGAAFEYGFNSDQIDTWVEYWTEKYNFKQREAFFNQFPNYKTNIQGLDIHFIRVKPQVPAGVKTVPLLLLHGWPGSVREFYEAIPFLTAPAKGYDFVFEVIVPSLPGYGFSDRAVRRGLAPPQIGVIFKNLMARLGHKKFYIQAGDLGSVVANAMSTMYPEDVLGFHYNLLIVLNSGTETSTIVNALIGSLQLELFNQTQRTALTNLIEETGYLHLQATKPDTIGISLSDSPIGLLAYILEKFSTGTRTDNRLQPDGGLFSTFSMDQLIDNLMVYWSTNSITTSMRLYRETFSTMNRQLGLDRYSSPVAYWNLLPRYDGLAKPPDLLKFPNLLGTTVLEAGHFVAFELPGPFASDVYKAVKAFREFHARKPKCSSCNCLSDSPVALLCFILEKFSTWTNIENRALEDGGLSRFSKDQLLDNLMVYWSSNCITTSVRIYAETLSAHQRALNMDEHPVKVPVWKLEPENEKIFYQAPNVLKHPHLLGVTQILDAGHFVAFEKPGPFAKDVFGAVRAFLQFHDTRRTEL